MLENDQQLRCFIPDATVIKALRDCVYFRARHLNNINSDEEVLRLAIVDLAGSMEHTIPKPSYVVLGQQIRGARDGTATFIFKSSDKDANVKGFLEAAVTAPHDLGELGKAVSFSGPQGPPPPQAKAATKAAPPPATPAPAVKAPAAAAVSKIPANRFTLPAGAPTTGNPRLLADVKRQGERIEQLETELEEVHQGCTDLYALIAKLTERIALLEGGGDKSPAQPNKRGRSDNASA